MTFKYTNYVILLAVFFLSGCSVSHEDSNIQYNKMYEDIKIEELGCGRVNQLTYIENDKKIRLNIKQSDCLYLIKHHEHLKRLGEDKDVSVDFISNGEFIDGIIINE